MKSIIAFILQVRIWGIKRGNELSKDIFQVGDKAPSASWQIWVQFKGILIFQGPPAPLTRKIDVPLDRCPLLPRAESSVEEKTLPQKKTVILYIMPLFIARRNPSESASSWHPSLNEFFITYHWDPRHKSTQKEWVNETVYGLLPAPSSSSFSHFLCSGHDSFPTAPWSTCSFFIPCTQIYLWLIHSLQIYLLLDVRGFFPESNWSFI